MDWLPRRLTLLHCRTVKQRRVLRPEPPMQQVTVHVPASTSNLGPGFDCLGLALRIYNSVMVAAPASHQHQHPPIISRAAHHFFQQTGRRPFSFSCSIKGEIPCSRGLGASASIRVGVLHALNKLSGELLDRSTIFRLCAELEGHPDNAAPAVFGGFTVARRNSGLTHDGFPATGSRGLPKSSLLVPRVQRFDVSPRLYLVLLVPDLEIQTARARKILPAKISHAGAVENCANACAITAAFASKNYQNLRGAFRDHLHQPHRRTLIPFLPRVVAAAENAGALGAFLSGSGSTICAIALQAADEVAVAMQRAAGPVQARTIITRADNRGAQISTLKSDPAAAR
jgi:homoserine kinase